VAQGVRERKVDLRFFVSFLRGGRVGLGALKVEREGAGGIRFSLLCLFALSPLVD